MRYSECFQNIENIFNRELGRYKDSSQGVGLKALITLEDEMVEAESYLVAMENEVQGMVGLEKNKFMNKLRGHRGTFENLQKRYKAWVKESEQHGSENLKSSNTKLDRSTALLNQGRSLVHEADDIGGNTIADLEQQKKRIEFAKENVEDTRSATDKARDVLKMIQNRAFRYKLFLYLMILLLGGLNVVVIYYGFSKKDK